MTDKVIPSFLTLPVELIYRILDNLDIFTILCSIFNVSTRINQIVDSYRQHKTTNTLQSLGNPLDPQTIYYLVNILQHDKTLRTLYLGYNAISDEGTQYLANVLHHNTSLTTLNLWGNGISSIGARHLANALQHNKV
ncbi:unnamed protein product [Rotaria sp. Silwood1]|nr:unnamed protein product [Rotaria sp. Silwood1]